MTATARSLETILRVAPQLTDVQLERLAASREQIDTGELEAAVERARQVDPQGCDAVDELAEPFICASVDRYQQWADREADAEYPEAVEGVVAPLVMLTILLATSVAVVLAVRGAAPWFAPLVVLAVSVVLVFAALAPWVVQRMRVVDEKGHRLDRAWDAILAAAYAASVAHTLGQPGGLDRSDFDLLTGPWSAQILPVTA